MKDFTSLVMVVCSVLIPREIFVFTEWDMLVVVWCRQIDRLTDRQTGRQAEVNGFSLPREVRLLCKYRILLTSQ